MKYTANQMKEMGEKELLDLLAQLRGELRQMRFLVNQGEWREMHKMQDTKKAIARILTVLSSQQKKGRELTEEKKQG